MQLIYLFSEHSAQSFDFQTKELKKDVIALNQVDVKSSGEAHQF